MQQMSIPQRQAVTHHLGPCLVLAGPGSGKTFTMIQRVRYLIEERGEAPDSLLVISFSRASAAELKERFHKLVGDKRYPVNFATFHACFFHILQQELHYTSGSILRMEEKRDILQTILTNPENNNETEEAIDSRESLKHKAEEYLQKISYYKNQGEDVAEVRETSQFLSIYRAYRRETERRRKLDFDDMGILCHKLLLEDSSVLSKWRKKFVFFLIDEFQDINPIQFRILQLLAEPKRNLFAVGDDDQAIYGFRGASPEIMLSFRKYYPETKEILLDTNYRCSANVVKEAGKVIGENKLRYDKAIRPSRPAGEAVIYQSFPDCEQEYAYIARRMGKYVAGEAEKGKEAAAIFRTNHGMMGLAGVLARKRIPFRMKERCSSMFDHWVAGDLQSYLRFFQEGGKRRDFIPVMNKPLRYLSRQALREEVINIAHLQRYYESRPYMKDILAELQKHQTFVRGLDPYAAIRYIRDAVGYDRYLKTVTEASGGSESESLYEIADFVTNSAKGTNDLKQWKKEIKEYEEMLKKAMEECREGIWLLTMHGCKGLEFDHVFLPDCNVGIIPHKRALSRKEIEEERRMFYVAMTRARDTLEILYLEDKYRIKLHPSPFLPIRKNTRLPFLPPIHFR
ncbi:MAG: ATP-dependent helicase [Lachnospiraceae bacterium]|nr:ATP-dependent helicase [Lachnospiraceae bacterium]